MAYIPGYQAAEFLLCWKCLLFSSAKWLKLNNLALLKCFLVLHSTAGTSSMFMYFDIVTLYIMIHLPSH